MFEEDKKQEIINYLEDNVWSKAERVGIEQNDSRLVHGIRMTRIRFSRLGTARKMVNFFWSAVEGTDRSIEFYNLMKRYNLITFEDLLDDFRVRFNDTWLRA